MTESELTWGGEVGEEDVSQEESFRTWSSYEDGKWIEDVEEVWEEEAVELTSFVIVVVEGKVDGL